MNTIKIDYKLPERWHICNLEGGFKVLCCDVNRQSRWTISKSEDDLKIPATISDNCVLHLQNNEETILFFECESVYEAFSIFQKSCLLGNI